MRKCEARCHALACRDLRDRPRRRLQGAAARGRELLTPGTDGGPGTNDATIPTGDDNSGPPPSLGHDGGKDNTEAGVVAFGSEAPITCISLAATCGSAGDGCGNPHPVRHLPLPETCGGGGAPSVCGDHAVQAEDVHRPRRRMRPAGDGCGNVIQCGNCTLPADVRRRRQPEPVRRGGVRRRCRRARSCTPKTCQELRRQLRPALRRMRRSHARAAAAACAAGDLRRRRRRRTSAATRTSTAASAPARTCACKIPTCAAPAPPPRSAAPSSLPRRRNTARRNRSTARSCTSRTRRRRARSVPDGVTCDTCGAAGLGDRRSCASRPARTASSRSPACPAGTNIPIVYPARSLAPRGHRPTVTACTNNPLTLDQTPHARASRRRGRRTTTSR